MPEGDTLHKLAARLQKPLGDATIATARGREQGDLRQPVGERVTTIRAVGKNLLIELTGGWTFRVHLGIGGSCRVFPRSDRERRPGPSVAMVIVTASHEVVFFKAPQARLMRTAHVRADPGLRHLGQDLLGDDVDFDAVLARLRKPHRATSLIGVLLLDQRVAAGIGNVFKCEVLFLTHVDPWATVESLDDDVLVRMYEHARDLMQQSVHNGIRITVPAEIRKRGERNWVYNRRGAPCLRCGTRVDSKRQGDQARMTYWCPGCQRLGKR